MAAPAPIGTPTTRANASGTAYTGDSPTGITLGEKLVAVIRANSSAILVVMTDLAGFTEFHNTSGVARGGEITLVKEADATDVANAGTVGYYAFAGDQAVVSLTAMFRVQGASPTIDETPTWSDFLSTSVAVCPTITTTGPDRLILRTVAYTTAPTSTFASSTELYDFQSGTSRAMALAYGTLPAEGAAGTENVTPSAAAAGHTVTVAIDPAPVGPPTEERLVPVAGGATTNLEAYDHTQIDDDPDAPDADWLSGTDPSAIAANITHATSVAHSGNPTTSATATIPATVNDGDILVLSVANGDGTAQPTVTDNSAIGSWTVKRNQAGTLMGGSVWWKRVTNQATERSKVVTAAGITGSASMILSVYPGCITSGDPIEAVVSESNASADNTMAGITTLTDGAMVCFSVFYSDNTAATASYNTTSPGALTERLEVASTGGSDSGAAHASAVKATAGATGNFTWAPGTNQVSVSIGFALKPQVVAAQTVNTEVRAPMSDPTITLATGAGTGEIRAQVGKLGSGSNPSGRLEIRNAAGTLLATALSNTVVSALSSAGGTVLSGTFDQSVVGAGTDVVVWVVGTGASGGLLEVGAVEWVAQAATAAVNDVLAQAYGIALASAQARAIIDATSRARSTSYPSAQARANVWVTARAIAVARSFAFSRGSSSRSARAFGVSAPRGSAHPLVDVFARARAISESRAYSRSNVLVLARAYARADSRATARATIDVLSRARASSASTAQARALVVALSRAYGTSQPVGAARAWATRSGRARGVSFPTSSARGWRVAASEAYGASRSLGASRPVRVATRRAYGSSVPRGNARSSRERRGRARTTLAPYGKSRALKTILARARGQSFSWGRYWQALVVEIQGRAFGNARSSGAARGYNYLTSVGFGRPQSRAQARSARVRTSESFGVAASRAQARAAREIGSTAFGSSESYGQARGVRGVSSGAFAIATSYGWAIWAPYVPIEQELVTPSAEVWLEAIAAGAVRLVPIAEGLVWLQPIPEADTSLEDVVEGSASLELVPEGEVSWKNSTNG